uniref:Cysteine rich secreted protein n=1 Tax=Riptortus pedestris TaxID=329032 RepID=R4WHZ0_RIPPE|nr:cysteine rich secreted protein [Riptortus pedestris]
MLFTILLLVCSIAASSALVPGEQDQMTERVGALEVVGGLLEPPYRKKCGGTRYCGPGYHCCDPWSCCPDGQHCCWDWRNPRCCVKPPPDDSS